MGRPSLLQRIGAVDRIYSNPLEWVDPYSKRRVREKERRRGGELERRRGGGVGEEEG